MYFSNLQVKFFMNTLEMITVFCKFFFGPSIPENEKLWNFNFRVVIINKYAVINCSAVAGGTAGWSCALGGSTQVSSVGAPLPLPLHPHKKTPRLVPWSPLCLYTTGCYHHFKLFESGNKILKQKKFGEMGNAFQKDFCLIRNH